MITEMSRIDHRTRISHRLKLAIIVLLSAQPVCTTLRQVEPASKSVVDSVAVPVSTSTDAAQPSLEELMVRFAEFEKVYWPFRVKSRQTYRTKEPLPTDPNAPLQPANKIELVETAQLDKLIWFDTVETIIGDKLKEFDRRDCNIEGVQNLSLRGALSNSFEAHGRHPLNYAPAVPLMGVFPIRMHDASDGLLLSEYYQKIPASCMLSWDGKLAKIEFNIMAPILDASRSFFFDEADDEDEVFGENEDRRFTHSERYQVWLDPDQQWHPSRLRRSYVSTPEVLIEEWEVTQFRQGTGIVPRILEGTIHRRAPVDHHIDFVIENSAYGEHVDPTHFHVTAQLPVTDAPSTEKSTNELRDEYTKHEQATQELAGRLKTITSEFRKDHPATEKRRVELRMAVHQSFKLRQELQRAELADFARRMKKLQQSIDARDRIADRIVERRLEELQDPTLNWEATESMNEAKSSEKAVTKFDPGISVADDNRQPPTSDAEKAISRLVIVFFQDQARRAVPGLMIDRGTETLVLTTGPATIVPDGVPHALDRAFLEFPGEANVRHTIDSPMNSGETPASSQIRQFLPTRQTMKPARFYMTFIGFVALALSDSCFAQASEPGPGKQVEQSFATSDGGTVSYLLYLPTDYDPAKKSNLILFLHGRGESYGPLNLVAKWGPPQFAACGDDLPYVLVSPQCPGDDSWAKPTQQQRLIELLDHIVKSHSIDEDSVCLTGLSMGGYGSWRLAADHPGRFASVVPVCGGGDPGDAEKLKALPIWVFHGDQDSAVPFQRSVDMVDAIRKVGGTKIRFTSLEHIGHNCWSATYATPELFQWISEQKH